MMWVLYVKIQFYQIIKNAYWNMLKSIILEYQNFTSTIILVE